MVIFAMVVMGACCLALYVGLVALIVGSVYKKEE